MKEGELVWIVSQTQPATIREISEVKGTNIKLVRNAAKRCLERGYLTRRRRPDGNRGPDPFEYSLSPLQDEGQRGTHER